MGAGAALVAVDTAGFASAMAERVTSVDVVGDENAFLGIDGLATDSALNPHTALFTNNTDATLSVDVSVDTLRLDEVGDTADQASFTLDPGQSRPATLYVADDTETTGTVDVSGDAGSTFTLALDRSLTVGATDVRGWFDGDDGSTISTTDGEVTEWRDKLEISQTDLDVAPIASPQPLFRSSGFDGRPAVEFGGTDDEVLGGASGTVTDGAVETTLFLVMQSNGAANSRPVSLYAEDSSGNPNEIAVDDSADEAVVTLEGNTVTAGAAMGTNPAIVTVRVREGLDLGVDVRVHESGEFRENSASGVALDGQSFPDLSVGLGGRHVDPATSTADFEFDGLLAEALIYQRALSDTELTTVEENLGRKWPVALGNA